MPLDSPVPGGPLFVIQWWMPWPSSWMITSASSASSTPPLAEGELAAAAQVVRVVRSIEPAGVESHAPDVLEGHHRDAQAVGRCVVDVPHERVDVVVRVGRLEHVREAGGAEVRAACEEPAKGASKSRISAKGSRSVKPPVLSMSRSVTVTRWALSWVASASLPSTKPVAP